MRTERLPTKNMLLCLFPYIRCLLENASLHFNDNSERGREFSRFLASVLASYGIEIESTPCGQTFTFFPDICGSVLFLGQNSSLSRHHNFLKCLTSSLREIQPGSAVSLQLESQKLAPRKVPPNISSNAPKSFATFFPRDFQKSTPGHVCPGSQFINDNLCYRYHEGCTDRIKRLTKMNFILHKFFSH